MGERVELYVLAVGQGSCNLVAFYDEEERMVQLDLIDCGRRGGKILSAALENQMGFIRKQMQIRANSKREETEEQVDYYLDYLVVSHADADHINLLTNKYFLKGLTPKKIKKDIASFPFLDESHAVLADKEVLLEYKKSVLESETYVYRIDLSSEGGDCEQTVDAELVLEWLYNPRLEHETIHIIASQIYYDFFDQKEGASAYILFKWKINGELYLQSMNCEIEHGDYIDGFETCFFQKYQSKITRTSQEGELYGNIDGVQCDEEEMIRWMAYYLNLEEENAILSFIKNAREEVEAMKDIPGILNVEYARSVLEHSEGEEGNCIIEKIIMGGLSGGSTENKKMVNAILNKLGCYNDYGIIYMETTGNQEEGEMIYLQKLPRYITLRGDSEKACKIDDENSGSITYIADAFGHPIVLPGDATGDTMWYFLNCLWNDENVPKEAWMTAPHHGSNVTTITKVFGDQDNLLETYLGKVDPKEIIISAGYENSFGHPHSGFLEIAQGVMQDSGKIQPDFPFSSGARESWNSWNGTRNIHSCLTINSGQCEYCNRIVVFGTESEPLSCEGEKVQVFSTLPQPQMQMQADRQENRGLAMGKRNGEFDFFIEEGME